MICAPPKPNRVKGRGNPAVHSALAFRDRHTIPSFVEICNYNLLNRNYLDTSTNDATNFMQFYNYYAKTTEVISSSRRFVPSGSSESVIRQSISFQLAYCVREE